MPRIGKRPDPLDPFDMDCRTVAELARVLDDRLRAVKTYGSCPTCGEAEAHAFLARLRKLLVDIGG
jgi:hypothetical protein